MEIFFTLFFLPAVLTLIDLIRVIAFKKRLFPRILSRILEFISVLVFPIFFLATFDFRMENDCCTDSAVFAPEHRLTIYCWIALCIIAFLYVSYRRRLAPPLLEVIVNALLLIGIVLNIVIAFQVIQPLWIIGNAPIILLFTSYLFLNQYQLLNELQENTYNLDAIPTLYAWKLLTAVPIVKFPLLLVACLPLVFLLTAILLLFGQKPNSVIQAFTQTYKHGFSELDHLCENVQCGGHYLCSVAANGHEHVVHPQRLGIRNKAFIICNRQLLVSNAFEEWVQEHFPKPHRIIRGQYNRVGNVIHKYYELFEIKWISDLIYFLMKPLEWFFLLVLYLFDRTPEDRIAQQYLSKSDRLGIKIGMKN